MSTDATTLKVKQYCQCGAEFSTPAVEKCQECSQDELRIVRAANRDNWCAKTANIADLIRSLIEDGELMRSDFEEIMAIVESPQRWSNEYEQMREVQCERNAASAL